MPLKGVNLGTSCLFWIFWPERTHSLYRAQLLWFRCLSEEGRYPVSKTLRTPGASSPRIPRREGPWIRLQAGAQDPSSSSALL